MCHLPITVPDVRFAVSKWQPLRPLLARSHGSFLAKSHAVASLFTQKLFTQHLPHGTGEKDVSRSSKSSARDRRGANSCDTG